MCNYYNINNLVTDWFKNQIGTTRKFLKQEPGYNSQVSQTSTEIYESVMQSN